MNRYIHHVSGRFRFKLPQLKGHAARAEQVEKAICQIKGTVSVKASTVICSVLVHYEAADVEINTFLESLEKVLLQTGMTSITSTGKHFKASSSPAFAFTDEVIGAIMGKIIERSAIAIVGAQL